jgi:hypothetical protein
VRSVGRLGAVGAGVAALAVAGLAVAAVSGGGGGTDDHATGSKRSTETTGPGEAAPEGTEPDPLCVAHQTRVAAVTSLGAVDSPTDRQALVLAELTFYSEAAEHEPEPDATAFRMYAQYFDALRAFYEPRGWENAGLNEIAEMPRPPAGDSGTRTNEVLAGRCGVAVPTDTPVEVTP